MNFEKIQSASSSFMPNKS